MALEFVIAPFAPANKSRAYSTRDGRKTSVHEKQQPTTRDAAKLAKQRVLATSATSQLTTERVRKAGSHRLRKRKPANPLPASRPAPHATVEVDREYPDDENTESNSKNRDYSPRAEDLAADVATMHPNEETERSRAGKTFGIFELCEMIKSHLPSQYVFRFRRINRNIEATIDNAKTLKEKLFLLPSSCPRISWVESLGNEVLQESFYKRQAGLPMLTNTNDHEPRCPFTVQEVRRLNPTVLQRRPQKLITHGFQQYP